jgi:hypothetical protein
MPFDPDKFISDGAPPSGFDPDRFLSAPTKPPVASPVSSRNAYEMAAEDQSFGENLLAGAGGAVEGWRLGLKQLLGRSPTEDEVREYKQAVGALRGTAGGFIGEVAANIAPGGYAMKGATSIPKIAALISAGGAKGVAATAATAGAIGGLEGAVVPVSEGDSRASNSIVGSLFGIGGSLLPGAVTKGYQALKGYVAPALSREAAKVSAGKMLNTAVGDQSDDVIRALRSATGNVNAAEGAISAASPKLSAMQTVVDRYNPDAASKLLSQQRADRLAKIGSFAGDDASLEALRAGRSSRMLSDMADAGSANANQRLVRETVNPPTPITEYGVLGIPRRVSGELVENVPTAPAIEKLRGNPGFDAAMADARRIAASRKNLPEELSMLTDAQIKDIMKDPTKSLEGLHLMKVAIDNRFGPNKLSSTALANIEDADVTVLKKALMGAVDPVNPLYSDARKTFAKTSNEMFQMSGGQEIKRILAKPLGEGENAATLARAIRDEKSLIRKAGGFDRANLEDQFTPANYRKIEDVLGELDVQTRVSELSRKGIGADSVNDAVNRAVHLPNLMNSAVAVTNGAIRKITGVGARKSLKELSEIMQDPAATAAIMEKATAKEKNAIRFLMKSMKIGGVVTPALVEPSLDR